MGRKGSCTGGVGCGIDVTGRWRTEAYVVCWFWGEKVMDGIV